jgi:hypothetical protein
MELTGSHTYLAPIDEVLTMLADPAASTAKYQGLGCRDVQILECERTGSSLRVRSSRIVDVNLPSFAKKVLKPTNTMLQTDEWHESPDGGWDGTFNVEAKGSPIHISGTMRLTPDDGACTHDVTISVTVKVPLVGGKIADWAAKNDVQRSLDGEFAFGDQWFAEHAR